MNEKANNETVNYQKEMALIKQKIIELHTDIYLDERDMKNIIIKKIAKIMKEPKNTDTGVKIFLQNKENKTEVKDIFSLVRKIEVGDTFIAKAKNGEEKTFVVQKSITGNMPEVQKSFLGKSIGDEIEVKGVKYTIINIGD